MHNKFTIVAPVRPGHQGKIVAALKDNAFVYPGAGTDSGITT